MFENIHVLNITWKRYDSWKEIHVLENMKTEKHDIMKIAWSTYRNGHDEKPKKKEWKQSDNEYEGPW